MKYLLHIDTSSDTGTIALSCDGVIINSLQSAETRNHASIINTMVTDTLAAAQISLRELSAVVVCAGPGSYTGLRIGMATAKGYCYTLDIPLLLDNKLDLLAFQAMDQFLDQFDFFVSILPAREQESFACIFDRNFNNILTAQHIMDSALAELISGMQKICFICQKYPRALEGKIVENSNMVSVAEIDLPFWGLHAFEQYKCNKTVNLSTSEPFYLKQVYTHKSL